MPSLIADMLEALNVHKGMRVLEIGAGTGYNAALIAELTQNPKNVYSIDI
jgi:protein-L-isoaspartate(D-aspartate) O-methyltransferase